MMRRRPPGGNESALVLSKKVLWCLTGGLFTLFLVAWNVHFGEMLTVNMPLDYGEGGTLQCAALIHQGLPLYPDYAKPPYWINPYTPLYLWLVSLTQGPIPSFAGGRALSFLATLATVAVPFWAYGKRWQNVAFACLFLVSPLVFNWSCLCRVDCLALFFTMAGLLLLEKRPSPFPAGLCFILAIWTKQSFLAAPLASVIYLAFTDRKKCLRLTLFLGALVSLSLGLWQWSSEGGFFHVQSAFMLRWPPNEPGQAWYFLGHYAPLEALLVPFALWAATRPEHRLWGCYLLVDLFWLRGCGRPGAFYNYFLEIHLALSWLAAQAAQGPRWSWLVPLQMATLGGCLSLPPYLFSVRQYLVYETWPVFQLKQPVYVQRLEKQGADIKAILDQNPGPVLAENLGLPLAYGRFSAFCDPFIYSVLFRTGSVDVESMRSWIRAQGPAVVILQRRAGQGNVRLPEEPLQDIEEHYQVEGRFGEEWVMVRGKRG